MSFPLVYMGYGSHADMRGDSTWPATGKNKPQVGLKELASGNNPNLDIVAIHGLGGDREGSWTAANGVLWLSDLLPAKIPHARILTYGYDANMHGQEQLATDYMHGHATTFLSKLALFREETSTADRAIIFVAYSSGGILLKSALIHSHLSHDGHLKHHHAISQSTYGVAFFSTPHQGAATAELARFFLDAGSSFPATSSVLLRHLERDSEVLQQQLAHYSAISAQYETKFFYELYDTQVTGGVFKRVVPKSSAVVPGAVNAESIGIHKDHVNMVKFPFADDDFRIVSTTLSLMSKTAPRKIFERWEGSKGTAGVFTTDIALTSSQRDAFSKLPRVNAARFDADSRPRCLEGTRVDLLKKTSEWTEQDISLKHRRIFWLSGQAGTGKTTISLTVAGNCQTKGRLGASFFFSRDRAERSDLRLVFPTLAQQLGVFHRPFRALLAKVLEQDPDIVDIDPAYQLKKLIIEPLNSCDSFPTATVIVIDALDECKDDNPISKILSILSANIYELPRLKFFITSRPENHILRGFRPLITNTESIILHEIEGSVVDHDIEHYLRVEFSTALTLYPHLLEPDWPSDEEIKSLVVKSGRLFIFAATAINFILDETYSDPPNQLDILLRNPSIIHSSSSPFSFLDHLYLEVLRHAFPPKITLPDRLTILRMIIGAIVLLCDPLSPGALESLLNLRRGTVRTTLGHLHSVIVVPGTDEHPIRVIHPSFFDFVMSRCLDADFGIDSLMYHEQLAIACFKQMKSLKRNICEIEDASKFNNEIEDLADRIQRYIPRAMQYACQHWPSHLCAAGENPRLQGLLKEFCRGHLLYWIEVLSLLGCLREGIRHLQQVHKFLYTSLTPPKELLETLDDNIQFIVEYFEPIACGALQLYRSALPLSAPSSSLSQMFCHELDGGIRVLQSQRERSLGVTILRGSKSWITTVAFSPDGTGIVSASGNEVRLWDCRTSTLLKELKTESNSVVRWAKFSPDGSRVISGTSRYTIWIWNVATGTCLQTVQLEDPGLDHKWMHAYTCSPDFSLIVGSMDNDIRVWDTSNGDLLNSLKGHSSIVRSVAFSPDHTLIASTSEDHTIRIWDAVTGTALRTLEEHSGSVWTIVFSPDGKYFSGSNSTNIYIWDVDSNILLKTLKGLHTLVSSVAFSPDSKRIISASDNVIAVWDVAGGELLKTISRFGYGVDIVGFSPDGTQYISRVGSTIYLWDTDRVSNLDPSRILLEFNTVEFVPDGNHLITRSRNVCHIWDYLTGNRLMSLESVCSATFVPNNKYIAFGHYTREICLWDIASKTSRTIELPMESIGPYESVRSVECSPDSTRIVSSLEDGTLQIWDVASGSILFTIDAVLASQAIFSLNGSQLIAHGVTFDTPLNFRSHPVPSLGELPGQIEYFVEDGWIMASRGFKTERCVWVGWTRRNHSSSHGRFAIWTHHGLVLLDASSLGLSI